jgi:diadenosine tetraphosphate (Ap4A) HIT family hydrolase
LIGFATPKYEVDWTMAKCPFCFPEATRIFHAGPLVLSLWDGFPVAPGHALLIPRRHVADWFEATPEEQAELTAAPMH